MKPITIRMAKPGELGSDTFYVEQDGKVAVALSWDEMIGQVAALTLNKAVRERIDRYGGLYRMQTPEELSAERERLFKRRAEREREDEAAALGDEQEGA